MLKNNKLNLLISIVCAFALWAYITAVVNPETQRTISGIKVDLVNIDSINDRGFTTSEEITYLVEISVSGARSEVNNLQPSDFQATADMTGYRRGIVEVPVNIVMPANIQLIQVRPETIPVEVVDLITVLKPVVLEFEEEFPWGLEPGFLRITPEEMEVSGVAEVVDNIDYIRALVKEGALTEELGTIRIDVVAVSKDGQPVYNVGLSQQTVEVTGAVCTTKTVPLRIETIGEPNESIEVTDLYIPSYITIRGSSADMEEITEVVGQPVDLSVITTTVEIPIEEFLSYMPEGIEVADTSAGLSVRIEVQGIARTEFTFTADMIEIRNLASFLSGHVNTGSVVVTVMAPRDVLPELKQEDINLYVDATDILRAVNSGEMEVFVECDIEVKEITIEPKRVRVTIIS